VPAATIDIPRPDQSENLERIIALEPSGLPEAANAEGAPPVTILFGDYLDRDDTWKGLVARTRQFFATWGGCWSWVDLALAGALGHSHMIMMDRGNANALDFALSR
jgi:hypothetical protein